MHRHYVRFTARRQYSLFTEREWSRQHSDFISPSLNSARKALLFDQGTLILSCQGNASLSPKQIWMWFSAQWERALEPYKKGLHTRVNSWNTRPPLVKTTWPCSHLTQGYDQLGGKEKILQNILLPLKLGQNVSYNHSTLNSTVHLLIMFKESEHITAVLHC